ncbi:MAG TPA: serine hydrolase [Chitinophagaceae bacterium]|nr:serine hydrolase [Chitinophagaceae bacterium]
MKKFLKRTGLIILFIIAAFSLYATVTGRFYLFKAVWYNFANIDDYKIFSNNTVHAGKGKPWPEAAAKNTIAYPADLNNEMESLSTVGLLMVKNNNIVFEKYWDGYSDTSKSGSFSMAKSITSLLVGAAIHDGFIKSVDEPAGDFIPEFKKGEKAKVRIADLLTMSSGSDWDESYANPFSVTTELYYGSDLYKTAVGVKIINTPGTLHKYKSGDTQLLGLVVEKATGKSLSDYAAEKLWQPLGAEHDAVWSTDHGGGYEKAYCCFNSNVRDFARIGKLMLDSGKIDGMPVIDSAYFANSIKPCNITDQAGNKCRYYGYQWWIDPKHEDIFYARGILGQYIIVIPRKKMIIVRLGKHTGTRTDTVPEEVRWLINWGLQQD